MTDLRIWTVRHTERVAAPPKRVYQLIADVDHWPELFDSVLAIEHLGYDDTGERVRFWGTVGGRRGSWVSSRETNPKRLQLRFRQEHSVYPLASLGGLWLVLPKGESSLVALDHYYRVSGDDPIVARGVEERIRTTSTAMLAAIRRAAEDGIDGAWRSVPNDNVEGVSSS